MAWWLAYFPPERFHFVIARDLRDPRTRLEAVAAVNSFAGMHAYRNFTQEMLENVPGQRGPKAPALSLADRKALLALRLTYRQSLLDLGTVFKQARVTLRAIPQEVTLASLRDALPADIAVRAVAAKGDAATPHSMPAFSPLVRSTTVPGSPEHTDRKLSEIIEHYNSTAVSVTQAAFPMLPFGEFSREAHAELMCPEVSDEEPYPVLSDKRKVLYILGTQKGGTTFLFSALAAHPNFVGAAHSFR